MRNRQRSSMLKAFAGRLRNRVQAFRRARGGVAAVEFALMAPAMLSVWVGMVVATDALTADKKVTLLARTLADMTTQMLVVSQTDLDSIFAATESILWPKPATALGMRLTSLDIDANGKVFVDWSVVPTNAALKGGFAAIARCTVFTKLPAGLIVSRTSVVLAEVSMSYQASVATQVVDELFGGTAVGGKLPLNDSLYMRPRQTAKVTFNPAPTANCPGYTP